MKRLLPYLKPYAWAVLLSIVLLFVQANADLALPDYMSRIVNTGIQQGGVESAVPEAIRVRRMETLFLFMSPAEEAQVRQSYELVEPASADAGSLVNRYPALEDEAVYVRNETGEVSVDALAPVIGRALAVASGAEQMAPGGLEALGALPESTRSEMMESFLSRFEDMDASMIVQSAAGPIRNEYEALGMNTARIQTLYILRTGSVMLLLTLLSAVCTVTVGFFAARIAAGFSRDVRLAIFERVQRFSGSEIDNFSTASLITRTTNDVMQIELLVVMLVRMVFYAPIIGVGGVIRAIGKSSSMWWIIAAAVGVLLVLVLVVYKIAVPKFKLMQELTDRLNLVSRETLSGMMVIRAFSRQKHEENRFDSVNTELTDTTLFVNRVMVVLMPLMMLIMNALSVLVIWVGAQQIAASSMQVGDMMAFLQYTMQIVFAFLMLSMMFIMLPRASVSAGRIADVLETKASITDPPDPDEFSGDFDGTVEFRNVTFRYPGAEEDVLHDISFSAGAGQTTAVIGATGSGKSTIVKLIPRFYDVTRGEILLGGKNIRNVTQHHLREKIGYVPQKATLFTGTIESNLRYADEDAGDDVVMKAARIAQAEEFIQDREDGMQAEIAQAGANVSGGQKQRLSIARALAGQRPVYLFDDSFSALDFRTDSALRRALATEAGGSTRLIVSQRVATVKAADRIVVLDEGRIAGVGTHAELMKSCETYREIALSQLTEEELS